MKKTLFIFFGIVLLAASCESSSPEVNPISEEHAALFGTWQEKEADTTITWLFERYEVKWKGFSHFYKVSGDNLIISGMVYRILNQSEKKMEIVDSNGNQCSLVRQE